MKLFSIILLCVCASAQVTAQQTVGLFTASSGAFDGYTLFAPGNSDSVYLIDVCGELQYKWHSDYQPGNAVYLLDNGNLLKTCKNQNGSPLNGGGAGGRIESILPNNMIEWAYNLSNDTVRQHHDVQALPNGNVLIVAWELKSEAEAIAYGRDPSLVSVSGLWPDHIVEYNPGFGTYDWEWHAWDHVIQDFDAGKPNYGVISDHPELFDLNFDKGSAASDWQHINTVSYNETLDQIMICSPAWNEIYIIDHSTTTSEAAGHTGGNSGKGGDILWRWGNPEMYGKGDASDRVFYGQHDAHWIPDGYRHENKIIVFNNGKNRSPSEYSTIEIINPSILSDDSYEMAGDGTFLPSNSDYTYTAQAPTDFFSRIISGADMLPNGNIIVCEGTSGHYFEVDSLDNVVWDYVNPVVRDSILEQEEIVPGTGSLFNSTFKVRKYGGDYPGLSFLNLVNQGPVELNPYVSTCMFLSSPEENLNELSIYPNPVKDQLVLDIVNDLDHYSIISMDGRMKLNGQIQKHIDVSILEVGFYMLVLTDGSNIKSRSIKFVKH